MNLLYGQIVELSVEDGLKTGVVRVGGALKKVPLELLEDAQRDDVVLVCDGVAISKLGDSNKKDNDYVPGNSR